MMEKFVSLSQNAQFRRLYRRGKNAVRPSLVFYALPNRNLGFRLGITAGKKVGGAVQRNRAKRRLRALVRTNFPKLKSNTDLVIVARTRTVTAAYKKLEKDFVDACKMVGIYLD